MLTYKSGDNDTLLFGKHKGKTIAKIAEIEPSYLIWAHEEIPGFNLEKDTYEALLMDEAEDDHGLTHDDLLGD